MTHYTILDSRMYLGELRVITTEYSTTGNQAAMCVW